MSVFQSIFFYLSFTNPTSTVNAEAGSAMLCGAWNKVVNDERGALFRILASTTVAGILPRVMDFGA